MDSKDLIQKIYKAYKAKDTNLMQGFLVELKKQDPNNVYISRYEKMLSDMLESENSGKLNEKSSKVKLNGVPIKCPNCGNYLRLTQEIKKQYQDFKNGKIQTLKFRCQSCGTEFAPEEKKFKSLFLENVGIGKEIKVNGKTYTINSVVKYRGTWYEGYKNGGLVYNEYLLVDKKGSMFYLSESVSRWDGGDEHETEISSKVIPNFRIASINKNNIGIQLFNGRYIYSRVFDYNIVKVEKIYGENTKSYKIGEEIKLYTFSYNGEDYVLENESSATQSEIGIYKTSHAKLNNSQISSPGKLSLYFDKSIKEYIEKYPLLFICLGILFIYWGYFLLLFIFLLVLVLIFFPKIRIYLIPIMIGFLIGAVAFTSIKLNTLKEINLNKVLTQNLKQAEGTYKIDFIKGKEIKIKKGQVRYDYGGVRDKFKEFAGIRFTVKNEKDLEILKKFKENIKNIKEYSNSYIKQFNSASVVNKLLEQNLNYTKIVTYK